jgi:uncharacterized protein (DUF433 family)
VKGRQLALVLLNVHGDRRKNFSTGTTMATRGAVRNIVHPYIEHKADTCGGRAIVKGTRIEVSLIAWHYKQGRTVDEILQGYPHLTPAQVHDALSYYFDHQPEIEEEIRLSQDHDYWMKQYPPSRPRG